MVLYTRFEFGGELARSKVQELARLIAGHLSPDDYDRGDGDAHDVLAGSAREQAMAEAGGGWDAEAEMVALLERAAAGGKPVWVGGESAQRGGREAVSIWCQANDLPYVSSVEGDGGDESRAWYWKPGMVVAESTPADQDGKPLISLEALQQILDEAVPMGKRGLQVAIERLEPFAAHPPALVIVEDEIPNLIHPAERHMVEEAAIETEDQALRRWQAVSRAARKRLLATIAVEDGLELQQRYERLVEAFVDYEGDDRSGVDWLLDAYRSELGKRARMYAPKGPEAIPA